MFLGWLAMPAVTVMSGDADDIEPEDGAYVSAEKLWQMKREAQAQDREAIARAKLPPRAVLFIKPEHIEGASIRWPEDSLNDD